MDVGTICLGLFAFGCFAGLIGLVVGIEVSSRWINERIVPTVPEDVANQIRALGGYQPTRTNSSIAASSHAPRKP